MSLSSKPYSSGRFHHVGGPRCRSSSASIARGPAAAGSAATVFWFHAARRLGSACLCVDFSSVGREQGKLRHAGDPERIGRQCDLGCRVQDQHRPVVRSSSVSGAIAIAPDGAGTRLPCQSTIPEQPLGSSQRKRIRVRRSPRGRARRPPLPTLPGSCRHVVPGLPRLGCARRPVRWSPCHRAAASRAPLRIRAGTVSVLAARRVGRRAGLLWRPPLHSIRWRCSRSDSGSAWLLFLNTSLCIVVSSRIRFIHRSMGPIRGSLVLLRLAASRFPCACGPAVAG